MSAERSEPMRETVDKTVGKTVDKRVETTGKAEKTTGKAEKTTGKVEKTTGKSVERAGDEFWFEALATPKKPQRNPKEKCQKNCWATRKAAAGRVGV